MVNFIVWLIVGAIAGWLAGIVMKSRQGLIVNIILGVIGSFVGGFVLTLVPGVQPIESGFSIGHILTAMVGAIIVIAIARVLRRA
ncbi:MAG: GlsB/YeaQ/YmgE family stress response membrane protein [Pleurocapsa minor GSE-CHR-MK-17-07R]|jgi:uncharacterized membrane protein YeaQ/YmgE (transglycosylase-associated protein family)|nr:GlsB/YeaQ/YmgE family stress response membrane protein [Pleurocapsa minor GSE-CHR-MK 17-07R]